MTRPPRNPRRAYDHDGREIPPMTLGNMREHGVRSVAAHCQEPSCGHSASVNVDGLPDDFPVPDVALRLRTVSEAGKAKIGAEDAQMGEGDAQAPASVTEADLRHAKHGAAILATCIVQSLKKTDPSFQGRFLQHLTEAYYEIRDNSEGDVRHEMELLSWTRQLLTGFSLITGQGKPFLER